MGKWYETAGFALESWKTEALMSLEAPSREGQPPIRWQPASLEADGSSANSDPRPTVDLEHPNANCYYSLLGVCIGPQRHIWHRILFAVHRFVAEFCSVESLARSRRRGWGLNSGT
jgi:hypothetical protein